MHVPMQRRPRLIHSLKSAFETQRPRNLSVPQAGQANRQARSPKGSVRLPGAFARNRDRGKLMVGIRQRIGSVRTRLCMWAASAMLRHVRILGHRRGGQSNRLPTIRSTISSRGNGKRRRWIFDEMTCVVAASAPASRSINGATHGRKLASSACFWRRASHAKSLCFN